jgi:hypothetical protein
MTTAAVGTGTSGAGDVPEVLCRDCRRPVHTAVSKARRLGEGCARRRRRRFRAQQLPLVSLAAAAGRRDPRGDQHRQALLELDQLTGSLRDRTDELEQKVHSIQTARPEPDPDPKAPHKYAPQPGDQTKDWAGKPATPCRWCQRPRANSIHRRPRGPRKSKGDARRELLADAGRARDRAVLGERDDQEDTD